MRGAILLLLAGLCVAAPVSAQTETEYETGSRIGRPKVARVPEGAGIGTINRGRIAMEQFSRCTLDRDPKGVMAALRMPLDGRWQPAIAGLAYDECLNAGEMRFQAVLMRGGLFTELWRRIAKSGRRDIAGLSTLPPIDLAAAATMGEGGKQQLALLAFADCVVTANRDAASEIVVAPVASMRQATAYRLIQPSLGPCLQQGSTITLSKPILEGALAEVLVRTVVASPPASGAQ